MEQGRRRGGGFRAAGAGLLLLTGFALVACTTTPSRNSAEPTEAPKLVASPLDGEDIAEDKAQDTVLAVKVDDTVAGQPQQGIARADLVIQEPVEGGLTRLMALYQRHRPESVGPVRSVRVTDIPLSKPVAATLVASGGSESVLAAITAATVPLIDETNEAFIRNPERIPPYNLYVNLEQLDAVVEPVSPPGAYLEFGDFQFPPARTIAGVDVEFSPSTMTRWRPTEDGQWTREGDEQPYAAQSLLILGVQTSDSALSDAAGNPVPQVEVNGKGSGFLVVDDQVHVVRWNKKDDLNPYELSLDTGRVVRIPPGPAWICLLPKTTGRVSFS